MKQSIKYVSMILGLIMAGYGFADELNMPVGVTEISRQVYGLHMTIFWVCVVIGAIVFSVMFWSIISHRRSLGYKAATFHESTTLELAWTVIPTLLLVIMAIPATQVLIAMYDTGGEDMTVEVRGYQWKWQYKYLDDDYNQTFSFFSSLSTPKDQIENRSIKGEHYLLEVDNHLRIPANRKVRFLITSEDVIHSWWVPDFAVKRDAVPGMLNELWTIVPETGFYRGQCTELCGKDHGFMPVVVEVMEEAAFDTWYAQEVVAAAVREEAMSKTFSNEELMAEGKQVYTTFCASCHLENGQGIPPVFPSLVGTAMMTGPRDEHLRLVFDGVPGSAMQAFGKQLDAVQLAAVVHYERHSWGNKAGDITQPRDVINLNSGQ
ncbi:MAG: cytochrome c oxidase subunit II [Gammaproteobacteria bacterium]|nr:cytochrome c oxidase subunit II [Gammaproteobacteria bacterium]